MRGHLIEYPVPLLVVLLRVSDDFGRKSDYHVFLKKLQNPESAVAVHPVNTKFH